MNYAGQVSSTIELLEQIMTVNTPADIVANQFFRRMKFIGSKDRKVISEATFLFLRNKEKLNWWISRLGLQASARAHALLGLFFLKEKNINDLNEVFSDLRHHPEKLSKQEEQALLKISGEAFNHQEMPEHVLLNIPSWVCEKFKMDFNDNYVEEIEALNSQAQLDLRINPLRTTRDKVLELLNLMNWDAEPTPYSPIGIRLERGRPLSASDLYKQGLIEVQDESSQIASILVDAKPGMSVLDLCAGAGGKSLAIAGKMSNKGRIVLMDVSSYRLSKARERLRRAGISNHEIRLLDSQGQKWLKRQEGRFDRVLLDVPCSGSGTWRRNPDLKWRFMPEDIDELLEKQKDILNSAASYVKKGGHLIYSTCSLYNCEDEEQIHRFLKKFSEFELVDIKEIWEEHLTGDYPGSSEMLKLTPYKNKTDGFFIAVLKRKK